jgi:hypothetical protein
MYSFTVLHLQSIISDLDTLTALLLYDSTITLVSGAGGPSTNVEAGVDQLVCKS